jgi:MFS family permease
MNNGIILNKKADLSPLRHRIAISVFFFTQGFTFASWASRIPHIQATLNLGEGALGSVLLALPVGLMISLLIAGSLIAKFGSKKVLISGAVCYSFILVLLGLATSPLQLVLALFLFGLAANFCNISVNSQAVFVEKMYGRSIMASFHGIWSLAGFSGAAVGLLMVWLKLLPWQHFTIISISTIICSLIFIAGAVDAKSDSKQTGFAWPDKKIMQLGLIAFSCLVCEGTMFDWSGIYFTKVVKAPAHLTSLGYAAFMGCMAAGRFAADKFVTALGPRKMLQYSGVLIASGLLLSVLFPTVASAAAGFMLVGFGVSSVVPIVYSMAGKTTTMSTGQALAAVSTVGFAGFLAGPPVIGFVAELTNLRWSFLLIALIGLSTSIMAGLLPKYGK